VEVPRGRTPDIPDPSEMRKVARMYYLEDLPRQTISARLNMDARKVTRLLKEARLRKVVRIEIPEPADEGLGARLREKYPHLERVLIAPGPKVETRKQYDDLFPRLGMLAADYFEELVDNHPRAAPLRIGVTGGHHLLAFANAVPQQERENVYVHVTALVGRGRLEKSATHIEANVVASILWSRCGTLPGHCEYATVSAYDPAQMLTGMTGMEVIQTELTKVEKNQTVRDVIEGMNALDVVFGGIGVGNPASAPPHLEDRLTMTTLLNRLVTPQDLEGAIGDFSHCPYDENGSRGNRTNWRLFLTAGHYSGHWGIEFYKQMVATGKKVVAFSTGPRMLQATKSALAGKIVNVLIIDEFTARQIVKAN